jgi:hypothetical protein
LFSNIACHDWIPCAGSRDHSCYVVASNPHAIFTPK